MAFGNGYAQDALFSTGKKLIGFDIETEEIDSFRDFDHTGITCAAARASDGEPMTWHGGKAAGTFTDRMSEEEAVAMVDYLSEKQEAGYQIATWNGLAFDFPILYAVSGRDPRCKALARDHVDMMFHFFCIKGFAISLAKALEGMGLSGKTEGFDGALAPKMWREGRYEEVLDYVAEDARATLDMAEAGNRERAVRWVSRRGKLRSCELKQGWKTVAEALREPEPDVSWMDDPWPRSRFTGWLDR